MNHQLNTQHKPFQPYEQHRVLNTDTGTVHVGHVIPRCMGATRTAPYKGSFQPVTCKKCLANHPERNWPTPQRSQTDLGKWVIFDFGYAIVAFCKPFNGGWRCIMDGAGIPTITCGGKENKTIRQMITSIIWYINNGRSWKANNTFCDIKE